MSNDINEVSRKMVNALRKAKSDQFALGYLESFMNCVIDKYVTDEEDFMELKMYMLEITCEYALESLEKK
jgi:hypothetical protein